MAKLLTDEQVQSAFDWLLKSSEDIAAAKGNLLRTEFKGKKVFARLFRLASGSVESRKAWATEHEEYAEAMEAYHKAAEHWELMLDQRNRAELIIEAWRTQNATERAVGRMR